MNKINTNNFDFLRVLFAFTVLIAHIIELSTIEAFKKYEVFFNTRLAISGFFVISGFLIAKSYENSSSLKKYLVNRVKRIIPAYVVIILFCAIFLSFISTKSICYYFTSSQFWNYIVANLTFQNYFEPCLPGVFENNLTCAVNGALWTIKIEEAFYLLLPVFYWIINFKKINVYIFSFIIYLASIAFYNYFIAIDMYRIAKQLPGALAFFISGIMFYKNFNFFIKYKQYFILPCIVLFISENYFLNTHILKPFTFSYIIFYSAYSFKAFNNFGKYGDFTYGIYIYHFPIIQLFFYFNLFNKYNPFIISFIIILLVLILAILSWHTLELRFLSKNRKLRQMQLLKS